MDSGLAALLGAIVGGVFSLCAGLLGPWLRDRGQRELKDRDDLQAQLVGLIESTAQLLRTRQAGNTTDSAARHTDAGVAISRIAVLLKPKDADVESVAARTVNTITTMRKELGAEALSSMQEVLHRWFRGEIKGHEVIAEYDLSIKEAFGVLETKDDAREERTNGSSES